MNAPLTTRPSLLADAAPDGPGPGGVGVYHFGPDQMLALDGYLRAGGLLQSILRVTVACAGAASSGENIPDVFGRCHVIEDGIRFLPHFPFEPGLSYRASFDPRPLGSSKLSDVLTLEFSFPKEQGVLPPRVTRIFPSSDSLPENLLRFYVHFSNAMQRGRVEAEISLFGPDGGPAPDTLYRAPVELWDSSMRHLTILLDPGRLKRGVGPNRELGPPLKPGQVYTLAVGAGMTGRSGAKLPETVYKRFRVTDAVRDPIAVEQWTVVPPETNSHRPLVITFPRPLDWALLSHTIAVASAYEPSMDGEMAIDQCERRWSFTPAAPWAAGRYQVLVASSLEDVCGNTIVAAFDRQLRSAGELADPVGSRSIPFCL